MARQTFGLLGELTEELLDPTGLALSYGHVYDALGQELRYRDPFSQHKNFA